jgi:hypothetical protein
LLCKVFDTYYSTGQVSCVSSFSFVYVSFVYTSILLAVDYVFILVETKATHTDDAKLCKNKSLAV